MLKEEDLSTREGERGREREKELMRQNVGMAIEKNDGNRKFQKICPASDSTQLQLMMLHEMKIYETVTVSSIIKPAHSSRNLGVILDSILSMFEHIFPVSKSG